MRRLLNLGAALALLATPLSAQTLALTCTFKNLPAGTQVAIEVEPVLHQLTPPTAADPQVTDAAAPLPPAEPTRLSWQAVAPAGGAAPSISQSFAFSAASPDPSLVRVISIRASYRITGAEGSTVPGGGESHEATFGVPVPVGAAAVSRCLRLSAQGAHLIAQIAADCTEASFETASAGDGNLHVRLHVPPAR